MNFDLRPATDADRAFVWALLEVTMRPLIEPLEGWDEAHQRGYAAGSLTGRIVMVDGEPAGILSMSDRGDERHLHWIAILPARQRAGLGTAVLRLAQAEAAGAGRPLTLRVVHANPARRLYERLGFAVEPALAAPDLPGVKILMRWTPSQSARA